MAMMSTQIDDIKKQGGSEISVSDLSNTSENQIKRTERLILVILGFAAVFWFFEAIVDVVLFNKGSLAEQIFTPGLYEIWMRVLIICMLIMFGVYTRSIINGRKYAEEKLRRGDNKIESSFNLSGEERKQSAQQLVYVTTHDSLTGLPNKVLFKDRLASSLCQTDHDNHKVAVMILDLDKFKEISNSFGHNARDKVLKDAGERISSVLSNRKNISRVWGDEFLVFIPEIVRSEEISKVSNEIVNSFKEPFMIDDQEFNITASIGIAIYPDNGKEADTLIRNASIAMYRAKEQGRNQYQFFEA